MSRVSHADCGRLNQEGMLGAYGLCILEVAATTCNVLVYKRSVLAMSRTDCHILGTAGLSWLLLLHA